MFIVNVNSCFCDFLIFSECIIGKDTFKFNFLEIYIFEINLI